MEFHLDEQSQLIMSLRFTEGLSLKEIHERTHMTYDQVRYKFKAAIDLLEKKLNKPTQ